MGNTPSGWSSPPYITVQAITSASLVKQASPANTFPIATLTNPGLIYNDKAGGAEQRMFVKFSLNPTNFYSIVPLGNWNMGTGLQVAANYLLSQVGNFGFGADVKVEAVTTGFTPSNMTWNNQGTLTYVTLFDGAGNRLAANFGALPGAGGVQGTLNVYNSIPGVIIGGGAPPAVVATTYGLRISVTVSEPVALADTLQASWNLAPALVVVVGK